jgi:tetratricopeptide (TPR) repeat protein
MIDSGPAQPPVPGPEGPIQAPAEVPGQSSPPRGSRRRLFSLALVGTALAAIALGWFGWRWLTTPVPPDLSLAGADPAVREAIETARKEVKENPRSAEAWGQLGLVLRAHGYEDEADVCFGHAQRFDPDNPRWPYLKGVRLVFRDPEAALPFLRQAVDLCDRRDPTNTSPRLLLAETLLKQGRTEEAGEHFRRVLDQQPENPRALFDLGVLAQSRHQWKASIGFLKRAATSPYTRQKACAKLAAIYQRLGSGKAAAKYSRRANQLPPDGLWEDPYVSEYLELAAGRQSRFVEVERLEAQGKNAAVTPILQDMVNDDPNDRSLVALGINLIKVQDFEGAERALRKAIHLTPGKIQAHYFLSVALFYQGERLWRAPRGNKDEALKLFRAAAARARKALDLKPDHAFANIYWGLSLQYLGRRAAAIKCFRTALRCRPEFVDPHLHLGVALAEAGQRAEALRHLKKAVKLAGAKDPRPSQALRRVRAKGKRTEDRGQRTEDNR